MNQLLARSNIAVTPNPKMSGTLRAIDLIILYAMPELLSGCGRGGPMMPTADAHPESGKPNSDSRVLYRRRA